MLDVAIIGGGPAGAAAALSLRQLVPEAKVAILTPGRQSDGSRVRRCRRELRRFWNRSAVGRHSTICAEGAALESFGTQAAWGAAELYEHEFLYSLHGNGWRLDRARFDAMLLELRGGGRETRCGMGGFRDSAGRIGGWSSD